MCQISIVVKTMTAPKYIRKDSAMNIFTKRDKIYFLICGIIIALCVVYVNHIYWEYRVVNAQWNATFTSPETFWIIQR